MSAPKKLGPSFYHRRDTSAGVNTIVAPAANTKGIRVSFVELYNSGATATAVLAKATTPTAYDDSGAQVILEGLAVVSVRDDEFVIPPGIGLFDASNAVGLNFVAVSYEVIA
mgnify:CR=1 FL=1